MQDAFPTRNWATPKFVAAGECRYDLVDFGGMSLTSTDFGERLHCDIKAAVPFNNKHKDDELRQVPAASC